MIAAIRGYKAILTMPDKVSQEKQNALKAYGAEIIVTPTSAPRIPLIIMLIQPFASLNKRLIALEWINMTIWRIRKLIIWPQLLRFGNNATDR